MKYIITINEKNYEVEVERGVAQVLSISKADPMAAPAPAPAAPAPVAAPAAAPAPAAPAAPAAPMAPQGSGEVVSAPMPGQIVNVVKSVGDAVKRGDTLLILEAMKMENEVAAPCDGVVSEILVSKGTSVSTGTPLVVIK